MSDSCPTCKRYMHACHCREIEAVAAPLRAEVERLRATGADASVMLTAYGESTHALAELARVKGATQDEIDRAMLGEAYSADYPGEGGGS